MRPKTRCGDDAATMQPTLMIVKAAAANQDER
jgi:hypothetical protein